jgi:hypothetical protein
MRSDKTLPMPTGAGSKNCGVMAWLNAPVEAGPNPSSSIEKTCHDLSVSFQSVSPMNPTPAQVFSRGRSFAVLLALAVTFLTGCVGPVRVPISSDSRTQLGEVKGIVGLQQQEIGTEINASNVAAVTGGFGAIGALTGAIIDSSIDDSRAKKAEDTVKPVRDALINYQPGDVLAADLQKTLAAVPGVNPSHTDVRQVIDPKTTIDWITSSGGTSVLLVKLSYNLSPNFDSIIVKAQVSLHAGGGRLAKIAQSPSDDLPPLVYYGVLSSTHTLPGLVDALTPDRLATLWSADAGRPAQAALTAGLQELADMIAYDLTAPSPPAGKRYDTPDGVEERPIPVYGIPGRPFHDGYTFQDGYIEHKVEGRAWVRLPLGELSAIAQ